jgi:RNA polymerase sigma-70 factor (ECF subfamily)
MISSDGARPPGGDHSVTSRESFMSPKKESMVSLAMRDSDRLADVASGVRSAPEPRLSAVVARERAARLRRMVDEHIDFVARVLRNAGTPPPEIDDEVQRTFITAARRIDDVRFGSERGFLLQTALHQAAHARRTAARRREVLVDEMPEMGTSAASPEDLSDQRRAREMLDRVLDEMHPDLRAVFIAYELEELTMIEIAEALGMPQGTVASRLRRARAEFQARVRELEQRQGGESTR